MKFVKHEENTSGVDYVVGDIHGQFQLLDKVLARIRFNPEVDRLFAVGDLIDRGRFSVRTLEFLAKPWFFAVLGNHESMYRQYRLSKDRWDEQRTAKYYFRYGGKWVMKESEETLSAFDKAIDALPVAREITTKCGNVGVVHAEVINSDWNDLRQALEELPDTLAYTSAVTCALWERCRYTSDNYEPVAGIDYVFVGHTVTKKPCRLGNVFYIDTGSYMGGGHLTICKITDTLTVAGVVRNR